MGCSFGYLQVMSEGSGLDTDFRRRFFMKQSCHSSQLAVSDQSDGSHLYATIDPPSPFHKRRRANLYSVPISDKSTDESSQDKRETCV